MALPPAFLDEVRARTPLASLVGRRVKLSRSGRNWKGCCPFHGEKTPSFYVYDDHFHCFGCGAHGDAISFVMQGEGASFMEAVERLASEAGLEVPKPTPQAAEAERRRLDLHEVLEAAQKAFVRRLHESEGAAGLAYLRGRGLLDETIARFGLGWSGEGRGGLIAELGRAGVEPALMLEAGLLREVEEGQAPREALYNRVTFPIRDRKGRLISFGGRTLGDAKPKYVNGPETAIFSKKRNLYALDLAREGVRRGAVAVAVEGYMDVIALHQAGFGGAVAPLGTALTEEQLEALWRLSPAPVLCFDGDAAGGRAAARAAELALPHLAPDRTLRLASLPGGEDPDTLVRKGGRAAFQAVLDAARPLSDALYDLMREAAGGGTPEQRAALRTRLEAAAARVGDKALAAEYRRALLDRFFEDGRARAASRARGPGFAAPARRGANVVRFPGPGFAPRPARVARPPVDLDTVQTEQARCLCAILLRHPELLRDMEEAFARLALPAWLSRVRDEILNRVEPGEALDSGSLLSHLESSGLAAEAAQVLAATPVPLPDCAKPDAMPADAELGWWHLFGLMPQNRERLDEEIAAASRDLSARWDEASQRKLIALRTACLHLAELPAWGETESPAEADLE